MEARDAEAELRGNRELVKFGYYILNTYVLELDGESPELYVRWLEQFDAAEELGFDSLWVTMINGGLHQDDFSCPKSHRTQFNSSLIASWLPKID